MNNKEEFQNCKIDRYGNLDSGCNIDVDFDCEIDNLDVHKFNKPTIFTQSDIDNLEKIDIEEIIEEEINMLDLKDNILPKGLAPLEDHFYSNDVPKKPKMEVVRSDIEERNIGIELKPKMYFSLS